MYDNPLAIINGKEVLPVQVKNYHCLKGENKCLRKKQKKESESTLLITNPNQKIVALIIMKFIVIYVQILNIQLLDKILK